VVITSLAVIASSWEFVIVLHPASTASCPEDQPPAYSGHDTPTTATKPTTAPKREQRYKERTERTL